MRPQVASWLLIAGGASASPFRDVHRNHVRDVTVASGLPSPWAYVGCQSDSVAKRTLNGAQRFGSTVTAATCINFCSSKGFVYAGTEYSNECYCGNAVAKSSSARADSECSMPCAGAESEACGGNGAMSLFMSSDAPPPDPVTNPGPGNWTSMGCYIDSAERTLSQQVATPGGGPEMSVDACTSTCFDQGYEFAGVEYASECYCGHSVNGNHATDGRCNMLCNGKSSEFCGGSYGLNVYGYGLPKPPVECPRWDLGNQTLPDGSLVTYECYVDHAGGDMGMTYENDVESCAQTCADTEGCEAFSWLPPRGGPCYLKSSVGPANSNQGVWGGVVLFSAPKAEASTTSSSTAPTSIVPKPTPSAGEVACPSWDQAGYTSPNGAVLYMECFVDHYAADLSMEYVESYAACADLCSTTAGCLAFAWLPPQGGPCYMKSAVGTEITNSRVWGGRLLSPPPPKQSSSGATITSSIESSSSIESVAPSTSSSAEVSSSVESSSSIEAPSSSLESSSSAEATSSASPTSSAEASSSSEAPSSSSESSSSSAAPEVSESSSSTAETSASSTSEAGSSSSEVATSSEASSSSEASLTSSEASSATLSSEPVSSSATESSEVSSSSVEASSSVASISSAEQSISSTESASSSEATITSSASETSASSSEDASSSPTVSSSAESTESASSWSSSESASETSSSSSVESSSSAEVSSSASASESSSSASVTESSSSSASESPSSITSSAAASSSSAAFELEISSSANISVSSTESSTISSSASPSASPLPPHWEYLGCYTDNAAKRALTYSPPLPNGNSVDNCQTACKAAGYLLAGMEYSNECYCGNTILNGRGPAPDGEAQCNMPCGANSTQICGGPDRLSMWAWSTFNKPSATTTSATGSATPTPLATIPANWTAAGCYYDNYAGYGRVMKNEQPDDQAMTIASCVSTCEDMGYTVAGMEYSDQCFCDQYIRNGAPKAPEDNCNMPCAGNSTEMCGAGDRLTVWSKGPVTVLPVPSIPKNNIPENWTYVGCVFDSVTAARPLPYKDTSTNNTVANCITACQKFGYPAAGVEYGEECYCGDWSDVWATGPDLRPDAECNMPCSGNASELCGTGGRLQTYFWNSTEPLNDWHYADGADAGEYKYMMGGIVIPLIATLGVNDKVSFLEKHGTGPPNSTGAYEYDPSVLDYSKAWRELHVKSDIFCAASLILPDKSGREINVGGWSSTALSGVRLFTPDGSPGVDGVNDWQENYDELRLQDGRWYPTAMIMANGKILVVGGQDGSNGPPVPTLEVLPNEGPSLYMDWLRASDPWNLYPFLAVMRGGIFVAYWNEARILDENTFDTIRVLPPIPGAVNAPQGGRSYPLEGTMVLLPQHAPYTESLEVLICGGSTKDNAALDNCVSTKPEDPSAEWVIERMPSKRVIPCMAALPDGTYIILNGGQQGQAGFALAGEPNHNAVLYDPTKERGSRMTVMANTTISRMYHSEAILLNDGRVLISGSDPQDARFPQEYIIEQFLPPYLLNGKPNPSYTIDNKDWAYGESVTVTGVSAPNGGIGSLKFSMLGAVSSTHSNSMGQRTIFPEVSCSGSTCTITAPPEAHIAPPGWFQLFAVDDGQPSQGIWIRLGKDPAELGNWPADIEDFAPLPGV